MSGYRGHLAFYLGTVSFGFVAMSLLGIIPPPAYLLGMAVGAAYAILPDIDTPSSKARQILAMAGLSISLIVLGYSVLAADMSYLSISMAPLAFLLLLYFFKHRGMIHTMSAGLFLSVPAMAAGYAVWAFAMWGYASHLILDGKLRL